MKLSELQAPFFRGRVITYATDGNTAVEKLVNIQKIQGRLHRGKTRQGNYCRLYLYYEELGVGLDVYPISYPDEREVEEATSKVQCELLNGSPQDLIALFDKRAAAGGYVRNAEITLARYIAPDKTDGYIAGRTAYLEQAEKRRQEELSKRKASEEAFCIEQNEKVQDKVRHAVQTLCNGGTIENSEITLYGTSRYDSHTSCMVNHLARLYGVKIPLKVQGWINQRLLSVTVSDGLVVSYRYNRSQSQTFFSYMNQLIDAVQKKTSEAPEPIPAKKARREDAPIK